MTAAGEGDTNRAGKSKKRGPEKGYKAKKAAK